MAERKHRKAIYFDLDTKKLNEYGFKNTRPAYAQIRKAFENLDFEHRQYSGYVSISLLSKKEAQDASEKIAIKLPWLADCVQKFDVTDIGRQYDLTNVLKNAAVSEHSNDTLPPKKLS